MFANFNCHSGLLDYSVSPRTSPKSLSSGLWILDLGLGFGTWMWDLDLGMDLDLTIGWIASVMPHNAHT